MRSYQFQPPIGEIRTAATNGKAARQAHLAWFGRVVALLVAGSGALNLLSLMGGPVPTELPGWLMFLLPLDFAGVSRTLTLVSGFGLILVAVHLWTLKRRAWQLAQLVSGASVVFHLLPLASRYGWNLEEALSSSLICGALWLTRKAFVVGSESPKLGIAAMRATFAFGIAGLYGAAGFWLLEPVEFHRNFHWWDALVRTVRLMLFVGDRSLVPHTPYATWFLDSLFWMSGAAFLYSGVILFRPVAYRFRVNWKESEMAGAIAERHGRTAQDFFKHWPDKSYFFSANRQSFLGYRVSGHYALVLGDPVGPETELSATVIEFREFCQRHGWRVGFHQVSSEHLPVYEGLGFHRLKVGDDAIVDVDKFSLTGSAMKEFRNTVNRLDRLGYRVERIDAPLSDALLTDLKRISDHWLEIPGHRERQFTLGRFERWYVQTTPVYVAFDAKDKAVAFLNLVPSYDPTLATVDLMRRTPEQVNGLMDYLFAKVFLDLKTRGIHRFSLGMAPLSDRTDGAAVSRDEKVVHWVMKRMPFLFRADSLRRFKAKYADSWKPRYAVYEGRFDLPRLALALRRVSEIPSGDVHAPHIGEAA